MNIAGIILLTGYVLNFTFIIYILFIEHHDSARRFSWLLAITFVPVLGAFLYILLSGNFFTRTKRMMEANARANEYYRDKLQSQHHELEAIIQSGTSHALENYGQILHMNLMYGKSPVLSCDTVHIFKSGEEKYRSLFAELRGAKQSIHLSYFIISNDETGRELIDILAAKARDGVEVRLLYDHVGSIFTSSRLFTPLRKAGGEVSKFFPVSIINPFAINYRNHRKIVVIDGTAGYFGGMNIGNEYANRHHARKYYWRDTHVRMTGSAVQLLQKQFLVDWHTANWRDSSPTRDIPVQRYFAGEHCEADESDLHLPEETRTENVPAQIVSAGPDDARNDEIRDAMTLMISRAKKSVYIETPYFTPDPVFYTALKIAALSGIDVRIIIPGDWDKWYVKLAAMPYVGELLSCGVKFWHYPGFIHSKMLVIDGLIATIGSTNVDARSFSLHFELNAFFYSAEFGAQCTKMYLEDENISREETVESFGKTPRGVKAIWNFFRLFAPLL